MQPAGLGQAAHDVEVLDCRTRGTLAEIVEHRDQPGLGAPGIGEDVKRHSVPPGHRPVQQQLCRWRPKRRQGPNIRNVEELLMHCIHKRNVADLFITSDNLMSNIESLLKLWKDKPPAMIFSRKVLMELMNIRLLQLAAGADLGDLSKDKRKIQYDILQENPDDAPVPARQRQHWISALQKEEAVCKFSPLPQTICTAAERVYASLPPDALDVLLQESVLKKPQGVTAEQLVEAFERTANAPAAGASDSPRVVPKAPYAPRERLFFHLLFEFHCEWCKDPAFEANFLAFMRLKTQPVTSAFVTPEIMRLYREDQGSLLQMARYFLSKDCEMYLTGACHMRPVNASWWVPQPSMIEQ